MQGALQHQTLRKICQPLLQVSSLRHWRCLATQGNAPPPYSNKYGMPVVYHTAYSAPQLAEGHRFPMGVFKRIYDMLLHDEVISPQQVIVPDSLPDSATLEMVHTPAFVHSFLAGSLDEKEKKRIGFQGVTSSSILIERTLAEVAGTLLTARLALEQGLATNTAGGTHHAFPTHGSGFCILNDLAITAKVLLKEGVIRRVLVLDLDVHQGDGTAVALQDEPAAFTFSVHGEGNFPARKQKSDLDIALPDGTEDDPYLSTVGRALPDILDDFRPQLVLYDAGVDPHIDDSLGRLSLTDHGLYRRELLVMDTCLARGIPVAAVVGGGYSHDLDILAGRHTLLHRAARQMWQDHC